MDKELSSVSEQLALSLTSFPCITHFDCIFVIMSVIKKQLRHAFKCTRQWTIWIASPEPGSPPHAMLLYCGMLWIVS